MTQSSQRIANSIRIVGLYLLSLIAFSLAAQAQTPAGDHHSPSLKSLAAKEKRLDSLMFQAEPVLAKIDREGSPSTAWSEAQLNYRLGDLSYVIALYKEARVVMGELIALLDPRDHRRRDIATWDAVLSEQLNELRMQIVQISQLQIRRKSL